MKTTIGRALLLGLLTVLFSTSTTLAAPAPVSGTTGLKEIPFSTTVLIHVKGVRGTADRLYNLIKQITDKGVIAQIFLENYITNGLDGRKLKGLEKDGPIFLAFNDFPEGPESIEKAALILKITSYSEFRDNILKEDERKALKKNDAGYESTPREDGKSIFLIDRKDYVVVTGNRDTANAYVKKGQGIDTVISKDLGDKLFESDLGVYFNMDPLNKKYADQIKEARKAIDDLIKSTQDGGNAQLKIQMQSIAKAVPALFQAIDDSKSLLASFEFRSKGLALSIQNEVRHGSTSNKFMESVGVASLKELNEIPTGSMFYTGFKMNPALGKLLGGILVGIQGDLDSPEMKDSKAAFEGFMKSQPTSIVGAASIPIQGVNVWNCLEPKAAMANQIKLIESLSGGNGYLSGMLKGKPTVTPKAQQFEGIDFTAIKLTWDLEKMIQQAGADVPEAQKKGVEAMIEKINGTEMNTWYGVDDKRYIQVIAKDWATAQKMLQAYLKDKTPVGGEGSFLEVRKELPAESTMAFVVDLVKYGATILDITKPMVESLLPFPANYPPAFQGKPSFSGFSLGLEKNQGRFDLYLSAQSLRDVVNTFVVPLIGN